MKKGKIIIYILLMIASAISCKDGVKAEQTPNIEDSEFNMGVHFNQWFEAGNVGQIDFSKYSKVDFVNVKKLGGGIIRLPINFQAMTNGTPDYKINDTFYTYLDKAVSWAEELKLYIIIDNHTFYSDGSIYNTIEPQLIKIWDQVSKRYNTRSKFVLYEICNEPHDVADDTWGSIQQNLINVIRRNDNVHTIIVNPSGWSSYNNLKKLPVYTDTNLIYDFHFYDPMLFTHQSASFINPPTTSLKNIPFPYDLAKMPSFPADLKGTGFEYMYNNYSQIGTVNYLKQLIDVAIAFRDSRHVKIFCGELGVHIPGAPAADRVFWYETVCSYLKQNNIPFTIWDYKDVFGIYNISSSNPGRRWFPDDLNLPLVKAIGFKDPTVNE